MGDFAGQIAIQEWWSGFGFWLLVAGLIGEIVVLAIPAHRGSLEKLLSLAFTVVVIAGCAFEHVAENRISDLIALEEASAGKEIEAAKNSAAQATRQAAKLGVTVDKLPRFVTAKEAEIKSQISDFQKFATTERAQSAVTIAELKRDQGALEKARSDALAAAKQAEANASRTLPRAIAPEKLPALVGCLKAVPKGPVTMRPMSFDWEAVKFSGQIASALKAAGFSVDTEKGAVLSWSMPGAFVLLKNAYEKTPPPHVAGIQQCFLAAGIALPAYSNAQTPDGVVAIGVGSRF